jgi:class 3 adenylate cyclase/TolB-like protein/Tfp pilus assembly protein PilF
MNKSERRLAAIMFTDIVGYSSLTQKNERLALELLEEHNNLIRPLLEIHNGIEIKTIGDSFMIEFASSLHAVQCAIAIQGTLNGHNASQPEARKILIRIGIHLGDIEHRGGDVFGDGVNIASRIEPLAEVGGICLSQQVYDQVSNQLEVPLESMGKQNLKNIQAPLEVYKVVLPWTKEPAKEKVRSLGAKKAGLYGVGIVTLIVVVVMGWWVTSTFTLPLTSAPQTISSLAVLAFKNLSADEDDEYFSDGVAEEILNALANIDGLSVRGSVSSFSFKGTELAIPEIARQLNVEAILHGSVRKDGNQVRIIAQLSRASDDTLLWSETFDHELKDIYSIQEEIANFVLNRLEFQGSRPSQLVEARTDNIEAYNLFLRGLFQSSKRTEAGFSKGIEYFEQTIALDPGFVQAYVGLADAYALTAVYGYLPLEQGNLRAEELAKHALELNENTASAYASLALVNFNWYVDHEKAEEFFLKSIELDPNYATAHHWYSLHLLHQNRYEEALLEIETAKELDPLSPAINATAGEIYFKFNRLEEATQANERALEIDPNLIDVIFVLARLRVLQGETERPLQDIQELINLHPDDYRAHYGYGFFLRQIGRYEEALEQFQVALTLDQESLQLLGALADINEILGQWDEAGELWRRRIALAGPENSFVILDYSTFLVTQNRVEEAFAQMEHALEIDPDVAVHHLSFGTLLYFYTKSKRGRDLVERSIQLDPTEPTGYAWLARILTDVGEFELAQLALDTGKKYLQAYPNSRERILQLWAQGTLFVHQRDIKQANQILDDMRSRDAFGNSLHVYIAYLEFELGLIDEGFASLQLAYEQRGEHRFLRFINAFKILNEEVLSDPRYHELLDKMGLAE